MANFSTADVKRLRELTNAGMMDCKQALTDAEGDFDQAVEALRLKGAKDVGKREQRTASNGLVTSHVGDGLGVLLELNCETDFVAKNERFRELAGRVAEHGAASRSDDAEALLASEIEPGRTVQQLLDETNATLGEKVELTRFVTFTGGQISDYLHRTSPDIPPTIGVLLQLDGADTEVGRDLTQHIAAMAPKYVTRDEVPQETVEQERRLAEQMARDEGKPEQAMPKIVEGRVAAYFKDFVLVEQPFVKDGKKTVSDVLEEAGVTVRRFARFKVGQA